MNIQFGDKTENIEREENLVVDGEVVGFIITKKGDGQCKYHCGIKFKSGWFNLIQGHGATKEEAVMTALADGRRNTQILLQNIDDFEARIIASGPATSSRVSGP